MFIISLVTFLNCFNYTTVLQKAQVRFLMIPGIFFDTFLFEKY